MALLTGGIAKIVAGATKSVTYVMTLIRRVEAAGAEPWETDYATDSSYSCRGFVADYEESRIDGTIIQRGDRQILIIGNSLSVVPQTGDRIVAQGETYQVVNVKRDPASATYQLQVRS